jgi:REP element-mobilizing transposase RayT
MSTKAVEILSDAIKEYYGNYELEELCNEYNVEVDYLGVNPNHLKLANKLVEKNDYNHRKLLDRLLHDLVQRCNQRILNTTWESNVFDEQMQPQLKKLQILLSKEQKPVQIAEPKNYHFKDNSELMKFLGKAKTALTLVDTRLGRNTFDCLKTVEHPIRLLTSRESQALADGFDDILRGFCSSCPDVEVRRHVMVHDRYIFFNGRCWLASASLDSIDSRSLNVIECIDAKSAIARTIERKWREAQKHLI